jgi:hypothetical protein
VAILVADDEMRYVAANRPPASCSATRGGAAALRVPDIAQYPEAEGEFEAMIATAS